MGDTQTVYEPPSVEEIDTGGYPINTAAGTQTQVPPA